MKSELNYRQVLDTAAFGYASHKIIVDGKNRPVNYEFIDINRAFLKLTGLQDVPVVNRKVTDIFPDIEKDKFNWIAFYGDIAINGKSREFEQYSESLKKWYKIHAFSLDKNYFTTVFTDIETDKKYNGHKQKDYIPQDISEERKTLKEVSRNEALYRNLMENSIDAVYLMTEDGKIINTNNVACQMTGYTGDELLKLSIDDIDPNFPKEEFINFWKNKPKNHSLLFNTEHKKKDGTLIPVEVNGIFFELEGDKLLFGVARNLTEYNNNLKEREKLQEQLSQAQKMESIGRLAGGVAHDFNNMLSIIIGYTELAMSHLEPDSRIVSNHLKEIENAARKSSNLTKQLLAFARRQTVSPRIIDLNQAIEAMLKMLERLIGEDIKISWRPSDEPSHINIDPTQFDQIFVNLCLNARDAIEGAGLIIIETGSSTFSDFQFEVNSEPVSGEYSLITVSDNGCGMTKEITEKLFEPYFTTKSIGKGTGLGLPTVYGIVRQNNGFINVYSEPGNGTTVRIYFPKISGTPEKNLKTGKDSVPASGDGTILLVEDDQSILELTKTILENYGYRVLTAAIPEEAVNIAEEYANDIDILITDVIMPGTNGRELAGRISVLCPELKTLYMSGYTSDIIAHQGILDSTVNFIQKPFSTKELLTKVRNIIDGNIS